MRFHRFLKTLTAIAVAMGVGLVVTASASADSGKIKFRGQADILPLIDPGVTTSTFEYKKDGSIKTVSIHTEGEKVFAGPLDVECKPSSSTSCDALDGSILFDVHSSDEVLRSVEVVPNPFSPGLDALSGKLSGELEGALSVIDVDVLLIGGTIQMKIHGTATLGCFGLFGPEPIATCEAGFGALLPVVFEVVDHGKFQLGAGSVGSTFISGGEGSVRVNLAGDLASGASGTVVINDATLFTQ